MKRRDAVMFALILNLKVVGGQVGGRLTVAVERDYV